MFTESSKKTFQADGSVELPRRARVKVVNGFLQLAGSSDNEIGTLEDKVFANGVQQSVGVRLRSAPGTCEMMVAGAVAAYSEAYAAADGKADDVANENFLGLFLESATGNGSIVEVLRQVRGDALDSIGAIDGNIVIDDDFVGDWPAQGTALDGQRWTKVETNGLGVTSVDAANGVLKFAFDAVAEAATATLLYENSPVDIDKSPIFEAILGIFDIGDDAAIDIDFGLASDDHATDFESVAAFAAFHLDGNDLSLKTHTDDGATDNAPADTGVDLVDDTFYAFRIDMTDKTNVKFYYRPLTTQTWTRVNAGTTYSMAGYSGALTPVIMVEKTNNDTTADVRADRVRVQAQRN